MDKLTPSNNYSRSPYTPLQTTAHLSNALPPPANTIIITGGPTLLSNFGPSSQILTCPYCHHVVSTTVENRVTSKTHLCALLLCICLCWPCCCLPYCMSSCQGRNHYCPQCKAFLGTYMNS